MPGPSSSAPAASSALPPSPWPVTAPQLSQNSASVTCPLPLPSSSANMASGSSARPAAARSSAVMMPSPSPSSCANTAAAILSASGLAARSGASEGEAASVPPSARATRSLDTSASSSEIRTISAAVFCPSSPSVPDRGRAPEFSVFERLRPPSPSSADPSASLVRPESALRCRRSRSSRDSPPSEAGSAASRSTSPGAVSAAAAPLLPSPYSGQ